MNASATDGGNGQSGGSGLDQFVVSPDGTKVAFQSRASNVGATDTNGLTDIYVRDLTAGTTTLVSVNVAGTNSGNGSSAGGNIAFSGDGNRIVFDSSATNLTTTPDTNGSRDVFVRDLVAGTTTLVSQNIAGSAAANSLSTSGVLDSTGTLVAFSSSGTNVAAGDTNATIDVFLRDLVSGTTLLLSPNGAGTNGGNGSSGGMGQPAAVSPDGTKVIYTSSASNLGPMDTNGTTDVYIRDLGTSTTSLASTNAAGTAAANGRSNRGAFSPDGTEIVFMSEGSNLGPTDGNGRSDVYVHVLGGATSLVSVNAAGTDSGNGASSGGAFSPNGHQVVFNSDAINFGATDTDGATDVYVRDRILGSTTLVSADSSGNASGTGSSTGGVFSPDGSAIAFSSARSNLVSNDTNGVQDVFVRASGATTLVSINAGGTDSGNGRSDLPAFAGSPNRIVFSSLASNLGATDTNGVNDLYVATLPTTPPPCETTTTSSTTSTTVDTTTTNTVLEAPAAMAADEPCETTTTTAPCSTTTSAPATTTTTTFSTTTTEPTTTEPTTTTTTTVLQAPAAVAADGPCDTTTTSSTTTPATTTTSIATSTTSETTTTSTDTVPAG